MARSVAIIGAGQIGYAACEAFLDAGWDVSVLARTIPPWAHNDARFELYVAGEQPTPSANVVVDTIAYDESDVARYNPDQIGRLISISSASVYVDYGGRSLEKSAENGYPDFGFGVTEEQVTVPPGPQSYSTRKIRMERAAIERFERNASIIRPGAVYGPWSRHPRELWFVKRLKDRRRIVPLAFDGESQFHTTDARSIGELALFLAEEDRGGIYNCADIDAPSVREMGKIIADAFGKRVRFYGIEGEPVGSVGRTPWSLPAPFIINCDKAYDAGFKRQSLHRTRIHESIEWLRHQRFDDWSKAFPQLAAYPWDLFDYEAEDRYLADRT